MFVIDHGHEEKDDGEELLLVLVTSSDDLGQGVDGLAQHVGGDAAGQENGGQQAEDATGADGGLAGGGHLAGVGGRHQGPHQVEDVQHVCHLLGGASQPWFSMSNTSNLQSFEDLHFLL